jgi:hypothetical protein
MIDTLGISGEREVCGDVNFGILQQSSEEGFWGEYADEATSEFGSNLG